MNEFFDNLSNRHGPVRMSKSFLDRLCREVESYSRGPSEQTSEGAVGNDASGGWRHVGKEIIFWAEIGSGPVVTGSGNFTGYSWTERHFAADGELIVPVPPAIMNYGDNGSQDTIADANIFQVAVEDTEVILVTTLPHSFHAGDSVAVTFGTLTDLNGTYRITQTSSTSIRFFIEGAVDQPPISETGTVERPIRPRYQPAFDLNGSQTIASGTKVLLMRGFLNTSSTNADVDPTTDPENKVGVGREWLIVGVASEPRTGSIEARITGRPYCDIDTGHKWYPAIPFDVDDADDTPKDGTSGGWRDGTPPIWLRANFDQPLGTDGNFVVSAWPDRLGASHSISVMEEEEEEPTDDQRPVYGTHDRIVVVNVRCVNGRVTPVLNGTYQGCVSGGLFTRSMFPSSMWTTGMFV